MKAIVRCSDGWRVAELMVTEGGDHKVKFWWGGSDKGWMNFVNHGCVYRDVDWAINELTTAHNTERSRWTSGIPWFNQHTTGFGLEADGRRWEVGL